MILPAGSPKSNAPKPDPEMSFLRLYARVLALLEPVIASAVALALANIALAFTQFAEPMLFGKVVDRLAKGVTSWGEIAPWLAAWAGFGLFSIAASVLVSLYADRLAHRRRLAAMAENAMNIAAIELMVAAQGCDFHAPLTSSAPLERVRACLRERVAHLEDDRFLAPDIAAAADLVRSGALREAAGIALPGADS